MLSAVTHNPTGRDDLYRPDPNERFPRDPMAGDTVYIKVMTAPVEPGQTVWLTWTRNGEVQAPVGAQFSYNRGNQSFWQAAIGPFARGDRIEYSVHANENAANEKVIGPFGFSVTGWSHATAVSAVA